MTGSLRYLTAGLSSPVIFCVALGLLCASPLVRGGNRYIALIGLEGLALLLLVLIVARSMVLSATKSSHLQKTSRLRALEWIVVLAPVGLAIFYLLPVPGWLSALGGGGKYSLAAQYLGLDLGWMPLSVVPQMTQGSLLATLPVLAMYLYGRTSRFAWSWRICLAFVGVATLQAILGLMQTGPFRELYFGVAFAPVGAIGTFANANHFANFLGMAAPVAVCFLLTVRDPSVLRHEKVKAAQTWMFGAVLFVLMCAVLASRSRAGMFTLCVVVTVAVWFQAGQSARRISQSVKYGVVVGLVLLMMVGAGYLLGAERTSARWLHGDLWADAGLRVKLMTGSMGAALGFLPFGAGPGAFASVYPQFQPTGLMTTVEYAHNDYLQWFVEVGIFAPILLALVGLLCWRQWRTITIHVRESNSRRTEATLQIMCVIGFFAIVLHSLVDFNFRIPANAMVAGLLLGVFMRPVRNEQQGTPRSQLSQISHL